jgi:hypothetical protein
MIPAIEQSIGSLFLHDITVPADTITFKYSRIGHAHIRVATFHLLLNPSCFCSVSQIDPCIGRLLSRGAYVRAGKRERGRSGGAHG